MQAIQYHAGDPDDDDDASLPIPSDFDQLTDYQLATIGQGDLRRLMKQKGFSPQREEEIKIQVRILCCLCLCLCFPSSCSGYGVQYGPCGR